MIPNTIRDYLALIVDEEVRRLTVANARAARSLNLGIRVASLAEALSRAFNWDASPEGGEFWVHVHQKLLWLHR